MILKSRLYVLGMTRTWHQMAWSADEPTKGIHSVLSIHIIPTATSFCLPIIQYLRNKSWLFAEWNDNTCIYNNDIWSKSYIYIAADQFIYVQNSSEK